MDYKKIRTPFVLIVMGVSIAVLVIDSLFDHGIISAEWWGYGFSFIFATYAMLTKDPLIKKFVLFGLVAGFAELIADHWLVAYTHSLIYPLNEPMLWSSPMYMPFSWTVVLVEFGFLGWLLIKKFNYVQSGLILAVAGALLVPLYEHWAISAGWWHYVHTLMIGPVPYYIILAEGLLMLPIPFIVRQINERKALSVIGYGLAEGVVMLLACFIAWGLLGRV